MPAFATLMIATALCAVVHVLVMAMEGERLGLRVSEIGLGFGPAWLRIGRLQLRVLPFGGYVRFGTPPEDALRFGPQLFLALVGTLTLLVTSIVILGRAGPVAFVDGVWQWVVGAASPFGEAQSMLEAGRRQALAGSFIATVGVVAAKLAALNLMPWPGTNGSQALAILGRRLGLAQRWPDGLTKTLSILATLVFVSWLVALVTFVIGH